jgi:hypothetical protein
VPRQLGAGGAFDIFGEPACPLSNPGPCTVVTGKRGHLLLVGDSQAESLIPVFTRMASRDGFTFSRAWLGGCPWQQNLYTGFLTDHCKAVKAKVYDNFLKTQKVDLVVVIELGYGEPGPAPYKLHDNHGKVAAPDAVAAETKQSVATLREGGRRVLLIDPTPTPLKPAPDFDPRTCLATAQFVENCRYTTRTDKPSMQLVYEGIADGQNVRTLDIGPMICPGRPVCDAMIGGVLVKADSVHVTADYALRMGPQIETFLRAWTAKDVIPPRVASP